jgi:hypothetical protein
MIIICVLVFGIILGGRASPHMKLNGVKPIRKANFIDPSRVSMYSEISNSKRQIPNKSQISISKDQNRFVILNFGHCDLFVIYDLEFL